MHLFMIPVILIICSQTLCESKNLSAFPVPEVNNLSQDVVQKCYDNCLDQTLKSSNCEHCIVNESMTTQKICCFLLTQIDCTFDCLLDAINCSHDTYCWEGRQYDSMRADSLDHLQQNKCPIYIEPHRCAEIFWSKMTSEGYSFSKNVNQTTLFILCLLSLVVTTVCITICICILNRERQHFIDLRIKNMKNESDPNVENLRILNKGNLNSTST